MRGYVNGNPAGGVEAKVETYAYDKATRSVGPAPSPKSHPDLGDVDRTISAATEMVRQYRARIANVSDVLVGEPVQGQAVNPSPLANAGVGGQVGALVSSLQYLGFALQELQDQVQRLENSVGL